MGQTPCSACFLAGGHQALLLLRKPAAEKQNLWSFLQPPVAAVLASLLLGCLQKKPFQGASETRLQEEMCFRPVGPSVLCKPLRT